MYHEFNKYKILRCFFDDPNKKFQLRELSRQTDISLPSVKRYVAELKNLNLIKEIRGGIYIGYKSSYTKDYKILKRNDMLLRLEESGLINNIEKTFTPNCIVLYGSAIEGTDDERGDIDLFVQSSKKNINLKKYEKKIKRKINILFEPDIKKINDSLKNTLANGIILKGFLKVI